MIKKISNEYFLSVEGETEKWYFEHLQNLINNTAELPRKVKFNIKINKSIISVAKAISPIYDTTAFHICDYESNEEIHQKQFNKVLKELKDVKTIKKKLNYQLGYSNFAFDLWIILHKQQQIAPVLHRKQYVNGINRAYNENFQFINDYKIEKNFKRVLSQISLNDVIRAVENGNEIRLHNEQHANGKCRIYGQFKYYTTNPDLTINGCIEQILKECGAIH